MRHDDWTDEQREAVRALAVHCVGLLALRRVVQGLVDARPERTARAAAAGLGPREITEGVADLLMRWEHPDAVMSYETVRGDLRTARRSA